MTVMTVCLYFNAAVRGTVYLYDTETTQYTQDSPEHHSERALGVTALDQRSAVEFPKVLTVLQLIL